MILDKTLYVLCTSEIMYDYTSCIELSSVSAIVSLFHFLEANLGDGGDEIERG